MKNQKGVALIVVLMVSIIVIAMLLAISVILLGRFNLVRDISDAAVASARARDGIEQAQFYDQHNVLPGAKSGICNALAYCPTDPSGDPANRCNNFTAVGGSGCDPTTCQGPCDISWENNDAGKKNKVYIRVGCTPTILRIVSVGTLPDGTKKSIWANNREGYFLSGPSNDFSGDSVSGAPVTCVISI